MSTPIPTFKFCETLGGTPIPNPGSAPAAGFRIGGTGGPPNGAYTITNNGGPLISGKTYNASGEFIETILNPAPGSYKLELRENPSLPFTDSWILTVTDVNKLPAAIPRERSNDPTDDPGFIDLALLGKNPLLVVVLTADNRFEAGDTVNATVTVKTPNLPDKVVPLSGTVATDQFGQKQPLVLEAANNLFSTGATVLIDYKLLRGTTPVGDSDIATAQVIGVALPDLFPPRFQKSIAGKLDPLDPANLQGANAQAEVLGALPGDTASMVVEGAPGDGSPTFSAIHFNTNKRANFALDSRFIAANMGKPVRFFYKFFRNDDSTNSEALDGSVERIADFDSRLPVPRIDDNDTHELDVTKLLPTSEFRLEAWPHQVPGQTGHLRYEGTDTNDKQVVYDDEDIEGVPLGMGTLTRTLQPKLIAWLQALKHGRDLKISFSLNYDGKANKQDAVMFQKAVFFPERSYRVDSAPVMIEENFDAYTTRLITPGQTIELQSMDIVFLSGTEQVGIAPMSDGGNSPVLPGRRMGQLLHIGHQQTEIFQRVRLDLKMVCSFVSFWLTWNNVSVTASYYDAGGGLIAQKVLPVVDPADAQYYEFSSPGISRLEFQAHGRDWFAFDYFVFKR